MDEFEQLVYFKKYFFLNIIIDNDLIIIYYPYILYNYQDNYKQSLGICIDNMSEFDSCRATDTIILQAGNKLFYVIVII